MGTCLRVTGLVLAVCLAGCSGGGGEPDSGDDLQFSGERAYEILGELCALGPRFTGSIGMRRQQKLIRERMEVAGATVEEQSFELQVLDSDRVEKLVNLIARFDPDNPERVAIVTHYDTRMEAENDPDPGKQRLAILGANDGGSGTAIMLHLAELLAKEPASVGVDLIFFDGEEWGKPGRGDWYCQGSKHFAERMNETYPVKPPQWVINLDMVGDADLRIAHELNSTREAPTLVRRVWRIAREIGSTGLVNERGYNIQDDHTVFWQRGIPAILLIDYEYKSPDGSVNYYHTHEDTLDKCSAESLGQVGRVMEAMLRDP